MQGSPCRPFGTRFPFVELTPDLRPGLNYVGPFGADAGWCRLQNHRLRPADNRGRLSLHEKRCQKAGSSWLAALACRNDKLKGISSLLASRSIFPATSVLLLL